MRISELCRREGIDFTLVIYPHPTQLEGRDRPVGDVLLAQELEPGALGLPEVGVEGVAAPGAGAAALFDHEVVGDQQVASGAARRTAGNRLSRSRGG